MPSLASSSRSQSDSDYERRRRDAAPWRAWYGTARWRAIRDAQLAREPLCRMCLAEGVVTPARVCDHIEPHRSDADKFWNGPFQSLCEFHHNRDKQRAEHDAHRSRRR
jgi:5-methylcytosine-specific restriction protein A